jgi:hypothetical protein
MTQDKIIELARQAGFDIGMWEKLSDDDDVFGYGIDGTHENLEAFAKLIAEKEREACAKVAGLALLGADKALSDRVLKAIRARGQE